MFQVSPRQRIHLKNQALFSSKDKSKKLKFRLLQFLYGALRANTNQLLQLCTAHTAWSESDQAVRTVHSCNTW